jgi:hypothetical protein
VNRSWKSHLTVPPFNLFLHRHPRRRLADVAQQLPNSNGRISEHQNGKEKPRPGETRAKNGRRGVGGWDFRPILFDAFTSSVALLLAHPHSTATDRLVTWASTTITGSASFVSVVSDQDTLQAAGDAVKTTREISKRRYWLPAQPKIAAHGVWILGVVVYFSFPASHRTLFD